MKGLSEKQNPIFLYELRQMVRTKFLMIVQIGFSLALLISMFSFAPFEGRDAENFSLVLLTFLASISLLLLPFQALIRHSKKDEQAEFIRLTPITAGQMTRGDLASQMVIFTQFLMLALPFLVFTTVIGNADLHILLYSLGLMSISCLTITQIMLWLAKISLPRSVLIVLGFISLPAWITMVVLVIKISATPFLFDPTSYWTIFGFCGFLALTFYTWTNGLNTDEKKERARQTRLLVTLILVPIFFLLQKNTDIVVGWFFCVVVAAGVGCISALAERELYSAPQIKQWPQNTWIRFFGFPFASGRANGFVWSTLLLLGGFWLMQPFLDQLPRRPEMELEVLMGSGYFVLAYVLTTNILRNMKPRIHLLYKFAILCSIVMLLPIMVLGLMGEIGVAYQYVASYLNPFWLGFFAIQDDVFTTGKVWFFCAFFLNIPFMFQRLILFCRGIGS